MHAFHMNLNVYTANVQFPAAGAMTAKQTALRTEMAAYNALHGPVNVAGFTEVGVPDTATPANVVNALGDLGAALGIPPGAANPRHIAVIRCGRTALADNREVVAIVLDGNATLVTFRLLYFVIEHQRINWRWLPIPPPPAPPAIANYTQYLAKPAEPHPVDYRFIVSVSFTLSGNAHNIGFIHNRAPGQREAEWVMNSIRNLMEGGYPAPAAAPGFGGPPPPAWPFQPVLLGGDFNVAAPAAARPPAAAPGAGTRVGGHHPLWYYSTGNTTLANPLDYWIAPLQQFAPGGPPPPAPAVSNATPNPPLARAPAAGAAGGVVTGSDHRGIGIDIA
jgi:hypothetical protein